MAENEEEDRSAVIAHFQEITGVEDDLESVEVLSAHNWNLESAVQAALNQRDPPPPLSPPTPHLHQPPPPPPPPPGHPFLAAPPAHPHHTRPINNSVAQRGSWLQWISSLTLFPLRFVVNTSAEILSFLVQLLFGSKPRPARDPQRDVAGFLAELEQNHGTTHPDLLQCSYTEALNDARQQLRFLLVYLHSPHHQDTPHFCRSVLATPEFTEFTRANSLLVWAVPVNTEEGSRVSNIFRENTYPFLVLVGLRGGRLKVCERMEGRVGREEVEGRLLTAIRNHEAEMVTERVERERRDVDKRLREEQDREFQASLEADKAKKREREQQQAEEEVRQAQKREKEEMEQRREEEFAREVKERRERLPPEPASSEDPASVVLISLRLPSGERLERRFHTSDQLQSLYDFAYTGESVPHRFTLVTNFPKKELVCSEDDGGGPSLGELALGPKSVVFMKDESD